MREFFKGWRRKMGLVTLGLALVLLSIWICCDVSMRPGVYHHKTTRDLFFALITPMSLLSAWLLLSKSPSPPEQPEVCASNSGRTARLCIEQIQLHLSNIRSTQNLVDESVNPSEEST